MSISIRANDFFIDHFQTIKSYIDDSLVSSIHFNAIFERKRKRKKKKNKWTIRKFSPLLTQPRDPSLEIFSNARYIKKKRLEYKRLVTQIPQMLRRKTNLSSVLLKHQAWSPVVATYNFAHEWATPISRAQKKISCKRGGRHHVLTRVPAWWTLVRGHQFLTVVHPVSNTLCTFGHI